MGELIMFPRPSRPTQLTEEQLAFIADLKARLARQREEETPEDDAG